VTNSKVRVLLRVTGFSSPSEEATAVAVGFQTLIETLQAVDSHFNFGGDGVIRDLRDRYLSELGSP